jgi:hypothetical protein
MAHVRRILETLGLIHLRRICNTCCFSAATTLTRTRLNVTFVRTVNCLQSLYRPCVFQKFEAPRFQINRYVNMARLSVLHIGRPYPQEISLVVIFVRGWVWLERFISMKMTPREANPRPSGLYHNASTDWSTASIINSNDTLGNRTRDLPASRAVLRPTAPLRT